MSTNKKNKKLLVQILKLIILVVAYGYIYFEFKNIDFKNIIEFNGYLYLFFAIILMPLNWLIESKKWQLLISKFEVISVNNSFKAVLSGLTTSIFTPNRVGEFVGRVMFVSNKNRLKATFATIIGSYSQVLITLLIGAFSVFFIKQGRIYFIDNNIYLKWFFLLLSLFFILLFFSMNKMMLIFNRMKYKHLVNIVSIISDYTFFDLLNVFLLSFVRYIVFYTQFYLLFLFFEVDISFVDSFVAIGVFYLFLAFIPTFILSEPGVRISTSMIVFSFFVNDMSIIVYTVSLLWLINIVFPTLIGSLFFIKQKF